MLLPPLGNWQCIISTSTQLVLIYQTLAKALWLKIDHGMPILQGGVLFKCNLRTFIHAGAHMNQTRCFRLNADTQRFLLHISCSQNSCTQTSSGITAFSAKAFFHSGAPPLHMPLQTVLRHCFFFFCNWLSSKRHFLYIFLYIKSAAAEAQVYCTLLMKGAVIAGCLYIPIIPFSGICVGLPLLV